MSSSGRLGSGVAGLRKGRQRTLAVILGLMACLLVFEAVLWIGGFLPRWKRMVHDNGSQAEITVLALGESTTVYRGADSWPSQLQDILNERAQGPVYRVVNGGRDGGDTSVLLSNLDQQLDSLRPAWVVAMMGANDNRRPGGGGALPLESVEGGGSPIRTVGFFRNMFRMMELSRRTPTVGMVVHRSEPLPDCDAPGTAEDDAAACRLAERAWRRWHSWDLKRAGRMLERETRRRPESCRAWTEYGIWLNNRGLTTEAEEVLGHAAGLPGGCWDAALERIPLVDKSNGTEDAIPLAQELHEQIGDRESLLKVLCRMMEKTHRYRSAVELMPQGFTPTDPLLAQCQGTALAAMGLKDEAEAMFMLTIDLYDPENTRTPVFTRMLGTLEEEGRHVELRRLYEEQLARRPTDHMLMVRFVRYLRQGGFYQEANSWQQRADRLMAETYIPRTRHNYNRMADILRARGIKLVAMQYPRRPIEPLRRLLDSHDGVVFVENRETFEQALSKRPFSHVFVDDCYGDFGHATRLGNSLIASSVADEILPVAGARQRAHTPAPPPLPPGSPPGPPPGHPPGPAHHQGSVTAASPEARR